MRSVQMLSRLVRFVAVGLLISLGMPFHSASAQTHNQVSIEDATLQAQAHLERESALLPQWAGASVDTPIIHYDLAGNRSAYVFPLVRGRKDAGFITVSAEPLPNPILEFSTAPARAISGRESAQEFSASSQVAVDLDHPLYLGALAYFYPVQGVDPVQLVEMGTNQRISLPDQTLQTPAEAQPQSPLVLQPAQTPQTALAPATISTRLLSGPDYAWYRGCGPTAAANAMGFYADRGFPNLVVGGSQGGYTAAMDELAALMGTTSEGWTWMPISDDVVHYAARHGYGFSSSERFNPPFSDLVSQIDAHHPVIVLVNGHIQYGNHFITAFGYQLDTTNSTQNFMVVHDTWMSTPEDDWVQFGVGYSKIWFNTVIPPAGMVIDTTPPISSVNKLGAYQQTVTFLVSWTGSDSGMGIKSYDVQYRDGQNGVWFPWLTETTQTSAQFIGRPGHTYSFQSRAIDRDLNQEIYPGGDGDTSTQIPSYFITGHILTNRDRPVMSATITSEPASTGPSQSGSLGDYSLGITAAGSYNILFREPHALNGNLPPVKNIHPETWVGSMDGYLLPSIEILTNGHFETGDLAGWETAGDLLPAAAAAPHSGDYAVQLGSPTMQTGSASISQVVSVPANMELPTLSLMYRGTSPTSTPNSFSVQISDSINPAQRIDFPATINWKHAWVDLSPYAGKTIKITLQLDQAGSNSGQTLYLDEVSLGPAGMGTRFDYLPSIRNPSATSLPTGFAQVDPLGEQPLTQ